MTSGVPAQLSHEGHDPAGIGRGGIGTFRMDTYATFSKIRKKDPPPPFEAEKYQSTFRNLQKYTQDPLFSPKSTKSTFRNFRKYTQDPLFFSEFYTKTPPI